ncbi:MAG: hypothetical protein RI897_2544 [Verrucomicrobiota bacterium]|jgi:voltage-gated potassium channel
MNLRQQVSLSGLGPFQIVILVLTILVLAGIISDTFLELPPEAVKIVRGVDFIVCVVFLGDFVWRFAKAESKVAFMKWGWIDLIASIPHLDSLRWARVVRVLRIIRLLRGIRSVHRVAELVFKNRLQGGIIAVATIAFTLVSFASVAILVSEAGSGSGIEDASDAIWWSTVTITTVGYGDLTPKTMEGRIIAIVLMVAGVGIYGLLSGSLASTLMGSPEQKPEGDHGSVAERLAQIELRLERLDKHLTDRSQSCED